MLNDTEMLELRRLIPDVRKSVKEILADEKVLRLCADQLSIRINNGKRYNSTEVAAALKDLTD